MAANEPVYASIDEVRVPANVAPGAKFTARTYGRRQGQRVLMTRAQSVHLHLRKLCSGLEGWPRPRQKHEACQKAPSYLYKSLKRAHARSHHTSKQHTRSLPSELKRHTTSQVNTVRTVKRCESSSQYTECQFTCEYGATLRPICPKS